METKFTADSTLSEITAMEGSLDVLAKYNVPCPHCPMAAMEMDHLSIGMICEAYGLDLAGILPFSEQQPPCLCSYPTGVLFFITMLSDAHIFASWARANY